MRLPEVGSLKLAKMWAVNVHLNHSWFVYEFGKLRFMHHEWTLN